MPQHKSTNSPLSNVHNQDGQSFIEFIFLLVTLIAISLAMVAGFNGGIGIYWRGLVQTVIDQNPPPSVELD